MAHVLVCGLGEVGYRVASLLLDIGEQVTAITLESRQDWLITAQRRGAKVLIGDARDEDFLIQAGVKDVDVVIVCTHNDGSNVEISLTVHRIDPSKPTVARIVDPGLARHAEKHLGVHRAIAMTMAAAPTFAAATFGDSVLTEMKIHHERYFAQKFTGPCHLSERPFVVIDKNHECFFHDGLDIKEGETAVVLTHSEVMVPKNPPVPGRRSLRKALAPTAVFKFVANVWKNTSVQLRAVIIAIVGLILVSVIVFQFGMKLSLVDSLYYVVTTATTTGYGDISPKDAANWMKLYACFMMVVSAAGMAVLFSVVTDYILTARMLQLRGHHHTAEEEHVIVVGVGTVGYRTIRELERLKTPVVAIELDESRQHLTQVRANNHVVIGDAREPETLLRAGIKHAKAIVVLTPTDAVNLAVGLTAKEMNPQVRVVLSILDADFARKAGAIAEIDTALSSAVLAAPSFVGMALYPDAIAGFQLDSTLFVLCHDPKGTVELAGQKHSIQVRKAVPS